MVLEPPVDPQSTAFGLGANSAVDFEISGSQTRHRFREFFRNFRLDNIFIYRDALIRHWNRREMFVEVDLAHLDQFDHVLYNSLTVRGVNTRAYCLLLTDRFSSHLIDFV